MPVLQHVALALALAPGPCGPKYLCANAWLDHFCASCAGFLSNHHHLLSTNHHLGATGASPCRANPCHHHGASRANQCRRLLSPQPSLLLPPQKVLSQPSPMLFPHFFWVFFSSGDGAPRHRLPSQSQFQPGCGFWSGFWSVAVVVSSETLTLRVRLPPNPLFVMALNTKIK